MGDKDFEEMGSLELMMHGKHDDVLKQMSPSQLQMIIDLLNEMGFGDIPINRKHSLMDGIDSINDILDTVKKMNLKQYFMYMKTIQAFEGADR